MAQIILNHQGIYSRAQIMWAKGVIAKDPDILAIPVKDGIIPFSQEPSASGTPVVQKRQQTDFSKEQLS